MLLPGFANKTVPGLAARNSGESWEPLASLHSFFFPFLAPQNSPGLSCVFLTRIPESAISQEPFCPLPENELRNQDLDVDVPVAPGASFPLGLIS